MDTFTTCVYGHCALLTALEGWEVVRGGAQAGRTYSLYMFTGQDSVSLKRRKRNFCVQRKRGCDHCPLLLSIPASAQCDEVFDTSLEAQTVIDPKLRQSEMKENKVRSALYRPRRINAIRTVISLPSLRRFAAFAVLRLTTPARAIASSLIRARAADQSAS